MSTYHHQMVQTTASPKSKPQHSGSKQQNRSSPSTKQPNLNLPTDSFRSLSSPSASTSKLLPPLQVNHRDVECIYVRGATALTVLNSSELSSILDGVRQQASSPHHSGGGLSPSTPSPLHRSAALDKKCSFRTNANDASPMSTSSPHHHASRMQQGGPPASSSTIQDFLDMTDATKFRKEYVLRIGSTSPWSRSPSPLVGDASLPSSFSSPNDRTTNSQLVWLKQCAERLVSKEAELRELILREEGRAAGQVDFAARRSLAKVHLSL